MNLKIGVFTFAKGISAWFGATNVKYRAKKGKRMMFLFLGEVDDSYQPTAEDIERLMKGVGFIPDPNKTIAVSVASGDAAKNILNGS